MPSTWVIAPAAGPGLRLAAALSAAGHTVGQLGPGADFSAARLEQSLRTLEQRSGAPALIVYSDVPAEALQPRAFAEVDTPFWQQAFQQVLLRSLHTLQAVRAVLSGRPATLVMVGPSLGLVGAAGQVALSALVEGQRALLKSAARQCGAQNLRLNWLALSPAVFASELAKAELPLVPELGPPPWPLGRAPDLEHDAAGVLGFLGSAAGAGLTGATLNLDGGEWMLP
jgi:hypothetical protein